MIRCLRKEGYLQPDVDYIFRIVLPKLTYGLPVYPSSIPKLTKVQNFLQRCFKRKYISYQTDIYNVLEEVDRSLFKKISSMPGHPLYPSVPKTKESSARLRVPSSQFPRVNTQRLKNSIFNRLFFKYRVAIFNVSVLGFSIIIFTLKTIKTYYYYYLYYYYYYYYYYY